MESKLSLAYAIRDFELSQELKSTKDYFGYKTEGGQGPFDCYMSNNAFKVFLGAFSASHRNQYENGDGSELIEKKNKWGNFNPPKMASFASSSRMIYNLSKDIPKFEFEKQLATGMGGRDANIDGFLLQRNTFFFVESKCQEIYGSHSLVRDSYRELFANISNDQANKFKIECGVSNDKKEFRAKFYYSEMDILHFDVKQMISHMLGIAKKFLSAVDVFKIINIKIRFIYFLYNPASAFDYVLKNKSVFVSEKNKSYIINKYNKTVEEINKIDMSELFGTIVRYQLSKNNISYAFTDELINSFSFELKSQFDFKKAFE